MVRACHLDTCPVGIATQRPELRAKFAGTPEMVVAYLLLRRAGGPPAAGGARAALARRGHRPRRPAAPACDRRPARSTGSPLAPCASHGGAPLRAEHGAEAPRRARRAPVGRRRRAIFAVPIGGLDRARLPDPNADRAVGARLGGALGRAFGVRAAAGARARELRRHRRTELRRVPRARRPAQLTGEANDYVGKGMSGGRIVIRPSADDAGDPVLVGNTALYGATGGALFCAGRAGERFAVRNSGAVAVVEGAGDHACEYMTDGTVVSSDETGRNVGAGMTGGELYVYDPARPPPLRLNAATGPRAGRRRRARPCARARRAPRALHRLGARSDAPRKLGRTASTLVARIS